MSMRPIVSAPPPSHKRTMDDGRWTMDDGRWGSVTRHPYPSSIVHRPSRSLTSAETPCHNAPILTGDNSLIDLNQLIQSNIERQRHLESHGIYFLGEIDDRAAEEMGQTLAVMSVEREGR